MRLRHVLAALMTTTASVAAFACGASPVTVGATAEAGIPDATLASGAWGTTECAACTFAACREERSACRADPGCARNLDCIEACPATAEGDPEPGCVKNCATAPASASEGPRLALERCRTTGGATACSSCVATHRRRYQNPLLNQACDMPVYDAGPDATPVQETCTKCGASKCCGPRNDCYGRTDCLALRDCAQACTTQACIDACNLSFESAIGAWNGLIGCVTTLCPTECGVVHDVCGSCLFDACADATIACSSDHDCYLLEHCSGKCDRESCQSACRDQYPGGVALYSAQLLCVQRQCPMCF